MYLADRDIISITALKKDHPSCWVVAESGAQSAICKTLEEKFPDPSK
jgi:hypothetical protein